MFIVYVLVEVEYIMCDLVEVYGHSEALHLSKKLHEMAKFCPAETDPYVHQPDYCNSGFLV